MMHEIHLYAMHSCRLCAILVAMLLTCCQGNNTSQWLTLPPHAAAIIQVPQGVWDLDDSSSSWWQWQPRHVTPCCPTGWLEALHDAVHLCRAMHSCFAMCKMCWKPKKAAVVCQQSPLASHCQLRHLSPWSCNSAGHR